MTGPIKPGALKSGALGVQCQLCGWPCFHSVEIQATCADAGCQCEAPQRLRVCPHHLPPAWLLDRHPQLAAMAARDIAVNIAMRAAQRQGKNLPGLRRPAIRSKPAEGLTAMGLPATEGQVAQVAASRNAATWRQTVAGFCDRAFGLLAELGLRIITAGEGVPRRPARKEVLVNRT